MAASDLSTITPLDGRYSTVTKELSPYLSEYALIKSRVEVEVKYLLALSKSKIIRTLTSKEHLYLLSVISLLDLKKAEEVKELEKTIRHDVKAVERFLRNSLENTSLKDLIEYIHFGLTSEDINNISYRLMLSRATKLVMIPKLETIVTWLVNEAEKYKSLPMLGRTHGQAAIPTTLGKELVLFASRIHTHLQTLNTFELTGKLGGAIGSFSALKISYPHVDWLKFSKNFIMSLGLRPNFITTQINSYDDIVELVQTYHRINSVLIGLDQDMWRYISDGWFVQEIKKGEVGSSTMPQKVNPIDFENSEGNLGMANSIIDFFSRKLMISRLQRDLSDSTTVRNMGTLLGYQLVGYRSLLNGFSRIRPNTAKIAHDLNNDWTILSEGVQTILRKEKVEDPYTLISSLSKGKQIGKSQWNSWVQKLPIKAKMKSVLRKLTPASYIGYSVELTEKAIKDIKAKKI